MKFMLISTLIAVVFWGSLLALLYIYAGYPLVIFLLARLKKPLIPPQGEWPHVTLLIAAYNEETVLEEKLENSLRLDYPSDRLQILVAADGSDDHTVEIVNKYSARGVDLSFQPVREGKSNALNRAMQKAQGEIVLFSDANNHYRADVLKKLVPYFQEISIGGVTGAKHVSTRENPLGSSEGLYWKYESFIKAQESRWNTCVATTGEIFAVRKALYQPIPRQMINDDFYTLLSLVSRGYRVHYAPEAVSVEKVSISAGAERERRARMTAGMYQVFPLIFSPALMRKPGIFWQILSHKLSRPLIPFAMLGILIGNLSAVFLPASSSDVWLANLARLAPPYNWIFLGLQAIFYLMALAGGFAGKNSPLGKLLYIPAFLVSSNFALLMGFLRFSRKRQNVSWQRVERIE
jgi:cellulose synthase/poly-beta-1,6-N-acetylglucosamine synthase-like glycosyltransferase